MPKKPPDKPPGKLLQLLKNGTQDKGMYRATLYLPFKGYKAFKAACEARDLVPSQVVAAFMQDFVDGKIGG